MDDRHEDIYNSESTMTASSRTPRPKLPVLTIVGESYVFLWRKKTELMFIGLIASALEWFVSVFLDPLAWMEKIAHFFETGIFDVPFYAILTIGLVQIVVGIAVVASFSVVWHRLFLIRSEAQRIRYLFQWKSRHLRFFYLSIVFGFLGTAIFFCVTHYGFPVLLDTSELEGDSLRVANVRLLLSTVSSLLLGIVFARWLLMFPSIAVDNSLSFKQGWLLTKGNGIRLFAITTLAVMPFETVSILVLNTFLQSDFPGVGFVDSAFFIVITALGISALSASLVCPRVS